MAYLNILSEIAALEDKLSIIKNKWMELVKLYPKIKKDEEEAFEILTNSDPTKNKQYLQWILVKGISEWKNKNLKLFKEDLPKITEALDRFENLKKVNKLKLTEKDINKFKNFSELFEMLQQYPTEEELSNKAKKKELEEQFFTKKQATLVHNDSTWKIVIPHTKEASCYFGVNTQWCTAAKNNNAFNEYNKDGNLYIILHKASNKRWQFHLQSSQLMDEKDIEVNFNEFNKKYPEVFGKHIVFSEKLQLKAVKQDGYVIQYIKNPSEKVQLEAVKQNGWAIQYIKNPSEKLQLKAVKQDGYVIQYIKNPSEKVQLEAVKQDGYAIQYIKNPSEKVQLEAVKQNGWSIKYIKNPSEKVQLEAVKQNGLAIQYIENPSEKVQLEAVKQDGYAIQYIKNPSEKVQLEADKNR